MSESLLQAPALTAPAPQAVRFDAARHYEALCEWWVGHGEEPPPLTHLPLLGAVVDGLAAGFVYEAPVHGDGPENRATTCFMHELVSNPAAEKRAVNAALDAVVEALLVSARARGGLGVAAWTDEVAVVQRARRHGFLGQGKSFWLARAL